MADHDAATAAREAFWSPITGSGPNPLTQTPLDGGTVPSGGRDDALAQIAAINADKTHPYWQGSQPALDEMAALLGRASGASDPAWSRPSAQYELTTDLTEDALPTLLRQDAASSMFELGLPREVAQATLDWTLGRSRTPPTLPESRTTADAAERTLREEWREGYDKQLFLARAGMNILDEIREQAGHGRGEIKALLRRSGHDNNPAAIKFFARLGGWYAQAERERFRQYAQRRRSGA